MYDPGTGSYVTVSIPAPHLLADSYSELRDAAGLRDSVHRIDLLPNSELGARSVFTFGRYGPAGDLFETIGISRYPDASATLRLPLPLNIHNTQGAPLIATHASTVAMPFAIPGGAHPINDQTFGFMQVYLDTPGQVRDDAYVDLSLPAASNTDIIVQVPVPVLTVGGEIVPGGSVINLRDGRILRAKRFQNTSPILITLVGDAVGNIVGGGGVGRPQIVERPRILQGRASLSVNLTLSVLYAPAQLVDNTDISVVARSGVGHQRVVDMNDVDPYWMAVDYSTSDYRNDMRTSDAYLMRKNGGVVPAPFSQLDPTSNEFLGSGSKTDAFLPAGHRLILPAGAVLTILPPQDAPRTPNYNRNTTLDVFFLPAGTMAEYEVPYSYTLKSESNSQNAPIANEFYRTASPSPLEIVTLTVDLSDFAMPYHLPGLPTVNVGGSINVVIKDQVQDRDFANTNRFIEATVSLAAVKTRSRWTRRG